MRLWLTPVSFTRPASPAANCCCARSLPPLHSRPPPLCNQSCNYNSLNIIDFSGVLKQQRWRFLEVSQTFSKFPTPVSCHAVTYFVTFHNYSVCCSTFGQQHWQQQQQQVSFLFTGHSFEPDKSGRSNLAKRAGSADVPIH